MSFEIYPHDLSTRYELSHATSAIMTIYYNDIGKLILVAPVNDYNIAAIKDGNMLYDTERDVTFDLVNTKIDTSTNKITANGYHVPVFWKTYLLQGISSHERMHALLSEQLAKLRNWRWNSFFYRWVSNLNLQFTKKRKNGFYLKLEVTLYV